MFKHFKFEYFLFFMFFVFSATLMWKTFYLKGGDMHIAGKVWSDFGATIPLERSFAYGSNFPPQYPIFAGPPIRYHFVFFLIVGMLERIGIPLDWGLNSLSIIGFFGLLVLIYLFAKNLFKSRFVGILSSILFLLNGSFSFLEFFKKNPLSNHILLDIIKNNDWSSFGPYDGKTVSAFWSLNIFTNQRHLALAYACYLGLLFYLYKKTQYLHSNQTSKFSSFQFPVSGQFKNLRIKKLIENLLPGFIMGVLIGLFPFIHLTAYMMMCLTIFVFFLIQPKLRWQLLIAGIIAGLLGIPQILAMGSSYANGVKFINPGYLISRDLSVPNFIYYWFFNVGLTSILSIIGFILAKKDQRKFFLPFLLFFIIGNIFQFSPEMGSNHKFFNMFVIGANMFSAYTIYRLWRTHWIGKLLVPLLLFALTLSGIIDLFPIFNDGYIIAPDIPNNKTAQFILKNTPPDSVFLNAEFINDPASIAGRKIYMGWPYFAWSAGYDTDTRFKKIKKILSSTSINELCTSLQSERIDYIEIKKPSSLEEVVIDYSFFDQTFREDFYNRQTNIKIYDTLKMCPVKL
jgi:hypothetical protein